MALVIIPIVIFILTVILSWKSTVKRYKIAVARRDRYYNKYYRNSRK